MMPMQPTSPDPCREFDNVPECACCREAGIIPLDDPGGLSDGNLPELSGKSKDLRITTRGVCPDFPQDTKGRIYLCIAGKQPGVMCLNVGHIGDACIVDHQ